MYLEERVEQLEKQQETTARAVADLTVDVRAIRHDLNEGFKRVNARLDNLESDVAVLKQDVAGLKQDVTELKQDVAGLKQDVAGLKQDVAELKRDVAIIKETLQMVMAYLREKLP